MDRSGSSEFEDNPLFTISEVRDAVWGCTAAAARNYAPTALIDDGSCVLEAATSRSSIAFNSSQTYRMVSVRCAAGENPAALLRLLLARPTECLRSLLCLLSSCETRRLWSFSERR